MSSSNPTAIANTFCADGLLQGTVSGTIRSGRPFIKTYFDYFAMKPCLSVTTDGKTTGVNHDAPMAPVVGDTSVFKDKYITDIANDVSVYNAMVPWTLTECAGRVDGALPVTNARMTFILRKDAAHDNGYCIYELHSSFKVASGTPLGLKCAGGEQECPADEPNPGNCDAISSDLVHWAAGGDIAKGQCTATA